MVSASRLRGGRLAIALALIALGSTLAGAAFDQAGYDKAASSVLCDCGCHPQSVADCACGRAAEMQGEIRAMIDQEMTGEAIIASYVAKHGEKILVTPDARGFNLFAWLGPIVLLFGGILGMVALVRRWSGRRGDDPAAGTAAPLAAEDDAYASRLKRELEEMQ